MLIGYNFNGSGNTANDNSGNGNNGTISGATRDTGGSTSFNWINDSTSPDKPSGLLATAGIEKITFTWNKNNESDLASYKVYRSTTSGFTPGASNLVASVTSAFDPVSWSDNNLQGGTSYYYRISAVDQVGNESLKTNEASATPYVPMWRHLFKLLPILQS